MKTAQFYGLHCHQWGIPLIRKQKWFYKIKKENVYKKSQVRIYGKPFPREGALAFQACWSWECEESRRAAAVGKGKGNSEKWGLKSGGEGHEHKHNSQEGTKFLKIEICEVYF